MTPDSNGTRRVALLIDTSTSWGVRLIRGISLYSQQHANWLFHVEPRGRYELLGLPKGWSGEGVIARINRPPLAAELVAAGLPTVNVSWYDFDAPNIARCTVNETQTGRMAAEYFLQNGFQNFGYCSPQGRPGYTDRLAEEYRLTIREAGHECHDYAASATRDGAVSWDAQLARLTKWLRGLPELTAVLCWDAARGRQVTEACHYAGLRIPDQIAVLGGEYDELMGEISAPPLSTVDQPAEQVGYRAAEILDAMMNGEPPPEEPSLLPPTRVEVRHSTDTLAIDDPVVYNALRFIRDHATKGISVGDVVAHLAIARRGLEQRFAAAVGRTPAEEIRRVKIDGAIKLLVETNLSMAEVSDRSGFGHQDLFSRVFRRNVGSTPTAYRKQHARSS